MSKIKPIVFILILSIPFFTANVKSETVTLGYVDFPPYEYEKDGKPAGIQVAIVKTLFERADISLKLQPLPFKRAYERAEHGEIDGLFNFYKIKKRLPYFDYSEPVIENPLVFFVRKDSNIQFNTIEDLRGLKVGVMRGYTYGEGFDESPLFFRESTNSHLSNFKKLLSRRIDAYCCDKLVGIHVARQYNIWSEIKILPTPLKIMEGHIGFTKGKHLGVIEKINAQIRIMKENKEIDQIVLNYIYSSK
ncbi:MAG: transporter substrate-binding domain-containing protein [Desulfobacteraceae bacterium]|nr:transporter substrate-binding domain-containing protein [Desulfobacteraceae bacterium]